MIWEIIKPKKQEDTYFGHLFNFFLKSIGKSHDEYRVNFDVFNSIAAEFGLTLESSNMFSIEKLPEKSAERFFSNIHRDFTFKKTESKTEEEYLGLIDATFDPSKLKKIKAPSSLVKTDTAAAAAGKEKKKFLFKKKKGKGKGKVTKG